LVGLVFWSIKRAPSEKLLYLCCPDYLGRDCA